MKKRITASILSVCLIIALCVTAGAISFKTNSELTLTYHLVPILNDSAVAIPGAPGGSYDYDSLYTKTTATIYSSSDSVTATTSCYNPMHVLESWTNYTGTVAKIRAAQSADATYRMGSNLGYATQSLYVSR